MSLAMDWGALAFFLRSARYSEGALSPGFRFKRPMNIIVAIKMLAQIMIPRRICMLGSMLMSVFLSKKESGGSYAADDSDYDNRQHHYGCFGFLRFFWRPLIVQRQMMFNHSCFPFFQSDKDRLLNVQPIIIAYILY